MSDQGSNPKFQPTLSAGPGGGPQSRTGERAKDRKGALRRLMQYLSPYRRALGWVVLVSALGTAMAIAAPYLMGQAIDWLMDQNIKIFIWMVCLMAGSYGVAAGAQLIQGIMIVRISQKAVRALRSDLFSHMQSLSLNFFDTRSQGELMCRLTNPFLKKLTAGSGSYWRSGRRKRFWTGLTGPTKRSGQPGLRP